MDASDADTSFQTPQTASADQPQASQPQRSRTTVVCGECKRLKLKCNREQPCASCLKRDTVPKCLYSAAAVEKLDVHSLNIRLAHVEAFTTTYTNGRFQPAYASANHPSQGHMPNYAYQSTQQNPGGYYHQHHHHAGVLDHETMAETFADPFQSLIPTCLADLGILQDTMSSIKLESSTMDNGILERRSGSFSNSRRMSKLQLKQHLRDHRTIAHTMLPSINVYFPATPSRLVSHVPQNGVPQVSSGLFSCLPPLATCQRLLQSAGGIFRFSPLPFDPSYHGWKGLERRCLQFLGNAGKNREEKRSRAVTKKARDIYLAGPSQPHLNESGVLDVGSVGYMANTPNEEDGGRQSLTFFAMTCAALAIGAVSSPSEDDGALVPSSAAFFYALSQQALGVWDTHVSSSSSKPSTTKGDAEQMEYLFASLLSIIYLLQSGTVAAASMDKTGDDIQDEDLESDEELQGDDSHIVTSLVGKVIGLARNMHLNKETKRKKKKSCNRDPSRDEWKRMIWWEIVFYDVFIADALGQQPHISPSSYGTNFPSCAIFSPALKSEGENAVLEDGLHGSDQDRCLQNAAAPSRRHDHLTASESRDEEAYFGARYQLARVAQAVKSRNSLPDCCCGYTLDQAVALENQVREWQDCLPASLKISGDDETQSTTVPSTPSALEGILTRLQAYELAIVANVLVINVYMPFLSKNSGDGNMSRFMNLPAASACIHAAQAIVHLANGFQSLLSDPLISSLSPANVVPVMFQFIPLEKLIFDAVVVCAHTAFAGKSPSMAFGTGMMAEDASLGLKILRKLGPPLLSSFTERDRDDDFRNRVIHTLDVRLTQRGMRLKRKLDEDISDGDPQDFFQSVSGGPATSHQTHQISQQDPRTLHHTFIMDSLSSPSTLVSDFSGSQSPPLSNKQPKSLNKEKSKKGRKGAKKHPAIGRRLREASAFHLASRSHPPPLAKAEDVWNFEPVRTGSVTASPSTDSQTIPTISPLTASSGSYTTTGQRSRSSSTSQVHPQTVDSSLCFGTPQPHSSDDMGMPPRKRPVLQDIRELQLQPQPMPFISHTFDQGHSQTQQDIEYNQIMPFDGRCPTAGPMDAGYRVASSTQSPYLNTVTVPETNTYDPHPPLSSIVPTTYYPSPTSFGSAYVEQFPSSNVIGLHTPVSGNHAPATLVDSQPSMMTIPNTPVYEHSQQPIENYSSHSQAHHMPNHPYHGHLVSDEPLLVSGWVTPPSQEYWDGRPS